MSSGTITGAATATAPDAVARYSYRERAVHWVNAIAYTYCMITGLALFTPFMYWMAAVLGGGATVRFWHPWMGLVYLVTIIWMHSQWKSDMAPIPEDKKWDENLKYYVKNQDDKMPPQGRFNAGQKINAIVTAALALLFAITGFFLWYGERNHAFRLENALLVHDWLMYLSFFLLLGHLYLALLHPTTRHSLNGITRGWVREDWARRHHPKWVEELRNGETR